MRKEHRYYVYILSSRSRTIYVGITNQLLFRVNQHREGRFDGFTKRYNIHRLVYFERFQYVDKAIAREKQIKGWLRAKKVALIESENPTWDDWYPDMAEGRSRKPVLRFAQDDNSKVANEA